jgi:BA14K-like protein
MSNSVRTFVAVTLVAASLSPGVAGAMPVANALAIKNAAPAATETVQWRRGFGWGLGAGLVTGAIVGGALASPYYGPYYGAPVYAAPPPVYYGPPAYGPPVYGGPPAGAPTDGDPVAYCMQRYRSFDPATGTYLGFDGLRHPCP